MPQDKNFKILVRTLQADLGWSYQACRNLLKKNNGDYNIALADGRAQTNKKDKKK